MNHISDKLFVYFPLVFLAYLTNFLTHHHIDLKLKIHMLAMIEFFHLDIEINEMEPIFTVN